jgi:hypothetical protein
VCEEVRASGGGRDRLCRLSQLASRPGKLRCQLPATFGRRRGWSRRFTEQHSSSLTAVIAWHLLSDPDAQFHDLGPGFYADRIDPDRRKRNHIRQLEALGYTVTLKPAA